MLTALQLAVRRLSERRDEARAKVRGCELSQTITVRIPIAPARRNWQAYHQIGTLTFPTYSVLKRAPDKDDGRTERLQGDAVASRHPQNARTLFLNTVLKAKDTVDAPIAAHRTGETARSRKALPGVIQADGINPDEYVISYEQRLEVTCPRMVRKRFSITEREDLSLVDEGLR
jgi:hypothetical protein